MPLSSPPEIGLDFPQERSLVSTITVPDGIPIRLLVSKTYTALAAGMQIVVRGTADSDGTLRAVFISFDGPVKS